MAGRPKDPTINHKIFNEIDKLLEDTHFREITIDQLAENTGISKATIYRRWKDKASIIVDMFVSRTQVFEHEHEDLYSFIIRIMEIYKTNLGRAVIEILISNQQSEARELFMKGYFESNRKSLKSIVARHIDEADQDMFIDLIFSPIYFNILIKPNVLDEDYIERMLKIVLKAFGK
ncbi:TetR family transcriptional regulator [Staphylococcus croceilyticus]|uniref:TetR family transcriptional regulator n=1 Tax=Staphylococcus croceilyticus TaxID=319942 RepID=A0ABY2KFL9_9STAP|nr:TetR/AcrR family transcriptional regulator C-terminal ligand-binding domain-containing protein [Staphylococcus croceilyticus]PNZ66966.1 TetR family transcriptional regulator [Staphylococcus croceilyticus]TGA80834.1 TetR family transcriptional regulator [Staphylococcus croceilyticus]